MSGSNEDKDSESASEEHFEQAKKNKILSRQQGRNDTSHYRPETFAIRL